MLLHFLAICYCHHYIEEKYLNATELLYFLHSILYVDVDILLLITYVFVYNLFFCNSGWQGRIRYSGRSVSLLLSAF